MLMYAGHMLSLLVYVMIIVTTLSGVWCLVHKSAYILGVPRWLVVGFLVSLTLQASVFIILQIDWVYQDFNDVVGDATAYAWLAFDYFNGFALLTFATMVRICLGWKEI